MDEALSSAVSQALSEIEILCIDAESTDGTWEIIQRYAKENQRVKAIHSEKKSYGYQMNMGIDLAKGEYIGILEPDDYVLEGMYESLYSIASKKKLDMIKSDFFRFTGTDGDINKVYCSLTGRYDLYRRVFEPGKEQSSFLVLNNTWNGLYRTRFLRENNIRHNESPGASFQDNGFYFQTFMHAKRAYLLNQAFYMNRRDNPGSSVFDKRKVYCICEEYRYIYEKLQQTNLWSKYRDIYMQRLYGEYYGNLSRISSADKQEFFYRFSSDFKLFEESGDLDITKLDEDSAVRLSEIMQDPDSYWKRNIKPFDDAFDEIEAYDRIIIYGAASIGWYALNMLISRRKGQNILCFAVTQKKANVDSFHGYAIRQMDELGSEKEDSVIVIAAKERFREDMLTTAKRLGFAHIVEIPVAG